MFFVGQSKYDRLKFAKLELQVQFESIKIMYSNLVEEINKKGGRDFLDNGSINQEGQFNQKELKVLARLVHPDKHQNSERANEAFQKISSMVK